MITNVYSSGKFITATTTVGGPYINPSNPSAGMVRYHNNQMQVYDGSSWLALGSTASVGLTPDAELLLDWVSNRRDEEAEARRLAEDYPAVADALNHVREAEQQLKTIVALCRT
jgi:hypothetical protein